MRAGTDAEAATFLTSTIDARDHPFILGATEQLECTFDEHVANEKAQGRCGDQAGAAWIESAQLKTFPDLVRDALPDADKMRDESGKYEKYFSKAPGAGA